MKTQPIPLSREQGNVLFTTVILAAILGITLAGYLLWVQSQNVNVAESQAWNNALGLAEAGIEEGMAQVNVANGTVNPTYYTNSAGVNHPPGPSAGPFSWTNSLVGGSYGVLVEPGAISPTITATGYSSVAYVGVPISRIVKVTTATTPLFGNGVAALADINTKGSGIYVDSYDSSDPHYSTGGMYDVNKRKAGGDMASTAGPVSIQGGNIYGHLRVGPSATVSIGNGLVGDLPANWPTQMGIETGWLYTDFNSTYPDVLPPYDVASALPWPSPKGNSSTYNLGSQNYGVAGDLSMKNGDAIMVDGANAVLYVTGTFAMQNGSSITITNGGSLKVYVGASTGVAAKPTTLVGVNTGGNASTFQFYGLPSVTQLSWTGNNDYVGTVYAPEAAFSLGGGGSSGQDYQGACVVYSIGLNGHFNIHFDEYLKRAGPASGFTVASWREL
jgi:hypothetical protein